MPSDSVAKVANDINGFSKNRPTHSKRPPQLRSQCAYLLNAHNGGNSFSQRKINKKGVSIPHNRKHIIFWRAKKRLGDILKPSKYWTPSPQLVAKIEFAKAILNAIAAQGDDALSAFEERARQRNSIFARE